MDHAGWRRIAVVFVAMAAFIFLSCAVSHAQYIRDRQLTNPDLPDRDGAKIGGVIAHAALKTSEELDTNIFLSDTDTKFDAITHLVPSVGLEVPLQDHKLSADYQMDIALYGNYHTQNYINHFIRGLAEFNFTHFRASLTDNYTVVTNRALDENSQRIKMYLNNARVGISKQFELLGFDLGYTNKIQAYGSNDITYGQLTYKDRDHIYNVIDGVVSYRFMPKTLLLLENDLGYIHYYNSSQPPDSWYDETLVGFRGEWFPKSNIDFKVGFRYQDYDNSDVFAHKSYIGAVMRGGFDYRPTDRDTVLIDLLRTDEESTYSNMNYYTSNAVNASYRHDFSSKLSAGAYGTYQLHLYPSESTENGITAKRYDNIIWAGANVRYDIRKWISVEAKYEYRQKISKFDIFDYIDNIVTMRGTVGF